MTHEKDEDLSALIDGELPAEAAARVHAHTAACAQCASRLERLGAASSAFKRSGEKPVPAGLVERAKKAVKPRRFGTVPVVQAALVAGFAVGLLILVSGAVLKRFAPSVFNNVQSMITGAAGQMGSGGK